MHIEHLHRRELLHHLPDGEAGSMRAQVGLQGDMEAVREEGDEDMRLDPRGQLMEDRPDGELALQVLEGCLDFDQLEIRLPDPGRVGCG